MTLYLAAYAAVVSTACLGGGIVAGLKVRKFARMMRL